MVQSHRPSFAMRLPISALPLVLLALAGPAFAQAPPAQPPLRVMMCELADESGTGWVPEFLMFTRQDQGANAGRIEVYDPILQRLVRRPIQAVVTADDRRGRTYGWALAKVRNQSGQYAERLDYRLSVGKSDGSAEMMVTAQGYQNIMLGRGQCITPPGE